MRKISLTLIIFLIIIIISIILVYPKDEKRIMDTKAENKNNMLSIMVEKEAGTGNYIDASSFPNMGYYLNKNLSKCINGSKISFSDGNLYIKGNKSDRCYAYFDKDELGSICRGQNMAECFVKNYKKDNTIIYHDLICDHEGEENCDLEAGDLSYRYNGASNVVNNYVCFGSDEDECPEENLYRIIGLFKNEEKKYEVKLIKYDYVKEKELGTEGGYYGIYDAAHNLSPDKYRGNKDNLGHMTTYRWQFIINDNGEVTYPANPNWGESPLNNINLNTYFYSIYLKDKWQKLIINHNWESNYLPWNYGLSQNNAKITYDYEIGNKQNNHNIFNLKIGLMYVSDYYYSASSKFWNLPGVKNDNDIRLGVDENWIYMGLTEWFITKGPTFYVYYQRGDIGNLETYPSNAPLAVRPVFYLKNTIKLKEGNGTKNQPYRLVIET